MMGLESVDAGAIADLAAAGFALILGILLVRCAAKAVIDHAVEVYIRCRRK
jgi:hypothetical protein